MPRTSAIVAGLTLLALTACSPAAPPPADPTDEVIGTWQLLTRTNLQTGEIDSVMNRRLSWEGFTRNTYHLYEMDLQPSGPTAEALKDLPPQERKRRFMESVNFVARGGMYRREGNLLHFRRVMSIDPNDIGTTPTAILDSVVGDYMYRTTVPNAEGVQLFQLFRRVQ